MRLERRTRTGAVIALVCIVGLFAAVGIGMAVEAELHELPVTLVCLAAFAASVLAWLRLRRRRLVLDERGLEVRGAFRDTAIAWDDVSHYFYWSTAAHGGFHAFGGIAIAVGEARGFEYGALEIVTRAGLRAALDPRYPDCRPLLEQAFAELHDRLRERPSDYAPFTLTATELSHDRAGALSLDEIRRVDLQRQCLVRPANKLLAWVRVPTSRIRNPMLFVEELLARGVQASVASGIYIPPLRTDVAGSRPAALPTAKTVQR